VPVNDPNWAYDPTSDGDGTGQCYLTQNELGNTDVDDGGVRLWSPQFDLSAGGYSLTYNFYLNLSIEDGSDRMRVQASETGSGGTFVNLAIHSTSGGLDWRTNTITPADFANAGVNQTSQMVFRFVVNDADSQSFVEAGVDGVRVQVLECVGLGTSYCAVNANSNGVATLSATGSNVIASNDVNFLTTSAPLNRFGYYLMSASTDFITNFGGSQGNLCVGTPILRFAGDVLNSGASGEFAFSPDLGSLPQGTVINPGETWNFQCWFRDLNPGSTSNTSNGLSIQFQ